MAIRFIRDIHRERAAEGKPVISIEFFPPKTPAGETVLLEKTIPKLIDLQPDYCSVTYGAGGSTRDTTLSIVEQIQKVHGLTAMSHLTCVNATQEEIAGVIREASERGIVNILALRGDPPPGTGDFQKPDGGFEFSYQLVEFIRRQGDFSIGVAGFPEGHIACREGREVDWERLKGKIDAGADFVITQLFFDNEDFFRFRDHMVKKLGTTVPLCPGLLPILSVRQIRRFTEMCGACIPEAMGSQLDELGEDDEAVTAFGIEYATRQCQELLSQGVPGIHFYCLNKAYSTTQVIQNLNLNLNLNLKTASNETA